MKKHKVDLTFCIWDYEDITHEEISQKLGIIPLKVFIKGQKKIPKAPLFAKENGWIIGPNLDKDASFEDQLSSLLNIIEPKVDLFKPFCEKYTCEFSCAIYTRYNNGESLPWIHLDKRYNKLINQLNIEFDIDLYCLPA